MVAILTYDSMFSKKRKTHQKKGRSDLIIRCHMKKKEEKRNKVPWELGVAYESIAKIYASFGHKETFALVPGFL